MADLNIFGVAQPTLSGITTILNLLSCHPLAEASRQAIWFSAREEPMIYINHTPFVLREAANPLQNLKIYHGISAARLESMESRLKEDVLREIAKWNQLLLVHEELQDAKIIPTWTALDHVQTPREVFESFSAQGYAVKYVRIPISPEQAPEDHYLDEYVQHIKNASLQDALVFNCGMGGGRTTFAMVLAMILRREQLLQSGNPDPLRLAVQEAPLHDWKNESKTTLRLVYMLEQGVFSFFNIQVSQPKLPLDPPLTGHSRAGP